VWIFVEMGRVKQVSPGKRRAIVELNKLGLTFRDIGEKLGVGWSCVGKIIHAFQTTGCLSVKARCGRPRCTTKREDTLIRRSVVKNPFITSSEIKEEMSSNASSRTIRRRLCDEFKLRARKPARKPLLNEQQRKRRIQFCNKYKTWSEDD